MLVYQTEGPGIYVGDLVENYVGTVADESPEEPGVFHIPGGCVEKEPPPPLEGKLRQWWAGDWRYIDRPKPEVVEDPVTKLKNFLKQNPDVAAILNDH